MRRRGMRAGGLAVLTSAIVVGLVAGQVAGAGTTRRSDGNPGFKQVPEQTASAGRVLGLANRPVNAIVQVKGDPVTVVEANAGAKLPAGQRTALKQQLRQKQDPVANAVEALGGTVEAYYQSAYNGLRVSIAPGKLAQVGKIANVESVHVLRPTTIDNVHGVPLIGAPQVWGGVAGLGGFAGEGIKIGVIDTGIDYTHADFGGPGTVAAYQAALATDTAPADPTMFGPNAPRVKGGVDLVGDDYNADPNSAGYQPVPHPDPNPLDCGGHGTHTAGTAAGSGVLSTGATYTGPYGADTVSSNSWNVGPGAAPRADIYSIRVFGCEGSTDVVVDAIEWAVDHDMDVINMSLGSPFGSGDTPDAVAADNAAAAGMIVVASSGNNGQNPYITGSPASASNAISVAANDPNTGSPGANITLSTGPTVQAIEANGISVAGLNNVPVVVLPNGSGGISLGCDPNEYTAAGVTGKIVVTQRGTCARVARAIFGQQAGAAAVVMVNNVNSFPPFEGPITSNPDTGDPYTVTIPFLGVPSGQAATWLAANGGTASLADTTLANPNALGLADFTSGGPRTGDSVLKPDVTAPGVSIASAGMGTGNQLAVMSGTSMAAPHTAGAAALVRQAHKSWKKVRYWKAAIVNTGDATLIPGYTTRVGGSGLVQVQNAVSTNVVALGDKNTPALSFGFAELGADYTSTHKVTLQNFGGTTTFTIGHALDAGSPHSIVVPASVTVPAGGSASVNVRLNVPAATAGTSATFADVAGLLTFTPTGGANHGVTLSVPYYLVPQAVSQIKTSLNMNKLKKNGSAVATVSNTGAAAAGTADWYAWGLSDPKDKGLGANDLQAVGVQAFPGVIAFGLSTYNRWSNAASVEFDVLVDVDGDNVDDYDVVGADLGALTTGTASGQMAVAVFDLTSGAGSIQFLADAPTDSSTLVLPVLVSQLCTTAAHCLSAANPRLSYHAVAFDLSNGSADAADGPAKFNAFTPSISTGMFDVLAPAATTTETVTLDKTEFALTPNLGVMIISHDNRSKSEAQLLRLK